MADQPTAMQGQGQRLADSVAFGGGPMTPHMHPSARSAVVEAMKRNPGISDDDLERLYHEAVVRETVSSASQPRRAFQSPAQPRPQPSPRRNRLRRPPQEPLPEFAPPPVDWDHHVRNVTSDIQADLTGKWSTVASWEDAATGTTQRQVYQMYLCGFLRMLHYRLNSAHAHHSDLCSSCDLRLADIMTPRQATFEAPQRKLMAM